MSILLILMAWFVEMPLWLSIVTTVIASVRLILQILKIVIQCSNDNFGD